MQAEISYDLVMEDDMSFVEGTYRLNGSEWQVFIASRFDVSEPVVAPQVWESGISGVLIRFPRKVKLNRESVERVLSESMGVSQWTHASGPDSMALR